MLDKKGQKLYTFTQCKEILMTKKPAKKRPVGRPKKTPAKSATKRAVGRPRKAVVYGPKRPRGRPKGSKNKPKPTTFTQNGKKYTL